MLNCKFHTEEYGSLFINEKKKKENVFSQFITFFCFIVDKPN